MTTLNRIRTVFTGVAGTPWYSNLYFDGSGGNQQDQVDAVDDFWTVLIGQIQDAVTATIEGDVASIDDTTGDLTAVTSVTPGTVNFTGSGAVLPPANQALLHLTTGIFLGGRRLRGRCFIPGLIAAAAATDGTPSTGFTAAQVGAMEALVTASNSIGNLKVYSPTYHTSSDVVGVTGTTEFAVLRSRRD